MFYSGLFRSFSNQLMGPKVFQGVPPRKPFRGPIRWFSKLLIRPEKNLDFTISVSQPFFDRRSVQSSELTSPEGDKELWTYLYGKLGNWINHEKWTKCPSVWRWMYGYYQTESFVTKLIRLLTIKRWTIKTLQVTLWKILNWEC